MDGFRVTINLHHFFHDHRTTCRLFVSDKLKIVQDLQSHISKSFEITEDFYLIASDNAYIPSTENTRILKEDDILTAIPSSRVIRCKSCRKHSQTSVTTTSTPSKKQRTNRVSTEDSIVDVGSNLITDEDVVKKKKKKPKREDGFGTSTETHSASISNNNNVKELYRDRKSVTVTPLAVSTKPNIVPIICVDDNRYKSKNGGTDSSFINGTEEKIRQHLATLGNLEAKRDLNNKDNAVPKILTNILLTNDTTTIKRNSDSPGASSTSAWSDLESVATETTIDETVSCGSSKRKRKRCRKKKQNLIEPPPTLPPPPPLPPAQIQFNTNNTKPMTHIRFDTNGPAKSEEEAMVAPIVIDETFPATFNKNELSKCPLLNGKSPKTGDIIAFKMYVLSQSYTPEISDTIIAKVLSYDATTDNVTVFCLEGGEQCAMPNGKFYLDEGDQDEESIAVAAADDQEKSLIWSELIQPRLIFP